MTADDATTRADRAAGPRQPLRLASGATHVVFTWAIDRWAHVVSVAAGAAAAWESMEGGWPAADPRWPASPALVELSRLTAAAGRDAVLGVGMAGRSHYSASVASDPRRADAVRFEIACRLHDGPGWLGSTYRIGSQWVRITASIREATLPHTAEWGYSIGREGIFDVTGATVSTGPA